MINEEILNEKLKIINEKIKEIDQKLFYYESNIKSNENKIIESLHKLEIKLQAIEISQVKYDKNWNTVINFIFQLIWVILCAYILLKLGLTEGMGPL